MIRLCDCGNGVRDKECPILREANMAVDAMSQLVYLVYRAENSMDADTAVEIRRGIRNLMKMHIARSKPA